MRIKEKLTVEHQKLFLHDILGFDVDERGVIYDCEGEEFYGYDFNLRFDLTCLEGIIKYVEWQAEERCKRNIQNQLRKLAGL